MIDMDIKEFFEDAKAIIDIANKLGNKELQEKMLKFKTEALNYYEENHQLNEELRIANDKLKFKEKLRFEKNAYWYVEGDKIEGPYCSGCWDKNKEAIRLCDLNATRYFNKLLVNHVCPHCNFGVDTRSPDKIKPHQINIVTGF